MRALRRVAGSVAFFVRFLLAVGASAILPLASCVPMWPSFTVAAPSVVATTAKPSP
ncbi:hypothetical protein PF005_g12174 [Phytophthora fragariae]|uniref:Uncharacterized protein n=1 Tax=Phytophthora fragariae TaxID=53985 RepID=A0A6A3KNA5_9STRA|nr:hypothetical protein PF011_g11495 [Phytophthora fragariae]KAE9110208.1 hypothetical protein PF007_g11935 [Phytophthora fragariae]KAE9131437.1 hypothetical protein PF006_g15520 [Phytophthora fragariae]KAE9208542.1 hypothetical protein PF005_g12174 [Phytophthora fragariae]KAE9226395.1 hypothetical protein PF004_g11653 [Phytophthora fragariae]